MKKELKDVFGRYYVAQPVGFKKLLPIVIGFGDLDPEGK